MRATPKALEWCGLYKRVWERAERYRGKQYTTTPRDLHSAKQLAVLNPDVLEGEIVERARLYMADAYWQQRNHPAYGLFDGFSRYVTANEPPQNKRVLMVDCEVCGASFPLGSRCKACEQKEQGIEVDVLGALDMLGKLFDKYPSKRGGKP